MNNWFKIVKLVIVSGKCNFLTLPPLGNLTAVVDVPVAYISSIPLQPLTSIACVKLGQFLTSKTFSNSLLPTVNSFKLVLL